MRPINEPAELERYSKLIRKMMRPQPSREYEFDSQWMREQDWKVVPVEDTSHFAPEEITTLVRVLRSAGYKECVAVATEDVAPDGIPCFHLAVSEADLLSFNWKCGALRYVLTVEDRSWAISCHEWYNLYAGKPELLEKLLGQSVDDAREEFLEYASLLANGTNPDETALRIAVHYAAL